MDEEKIDNLNSNKKDNEDGYKTRTCPHCKQEWKIKTGLSAENFKRLMRLPTLDEWITLFIIAMVILSAYAYKHDTQVCRDTLQNLTSICQQYTITENILKEKAEQAREEAGWNKNNISIDFIDEEIE